MKKVYIWQKINHCIARKYFDRFVNKMLLQKKTIKKEQFSARMPRASSLFIA